MAARSRRRRSRSADCSSSSRAAVACSPSDPPEHARRGATTPSTMKPVIALVGRANVGKSTLFNRLTRTRDAIVADFAGLTRDRHYGDARVAGHDFIVVDTGGFVPENPTGMFRLMARQAEQAVAEADAVVFVVDVRAGVSAHDHDIARYLRSAGKRVVVAANKAEGMADSALVAEFFELGLGDPYPVSAAHGQGVVSLAEAALEAALGQALTDSADAEDGQASSEQADADAPIRLAV